MTQESRIKAASCLQDLTVWNYRKCISDPYNGVRKKYTAIDKAMLVDIFSDLQSGKFRTYLEVSQLYPVHWQTIKKHAEINNVEFVRL